jgi:putative endonuclease
MTEPKRTINGVKDRRKALGAMGEGFAADFIEREGYRILERNWRCKTGEIDLIADLNGELVFLEVRTRTVPGRFGVAAESVDWRKCKQVRETALYYMHSHGWHERKTRFDVIAVELNRNEELVRIEHLRAAF